MRGYHPTMLDVAQQLLLKWERLNLDDEIDGVHDMTSLTFETIGLRRIRLSFQLLLSRDQSSLWRGAGSGPWMQRGRARELVGLGLAVVTEFCQQPAQESHLRHNIP